MTEIPNTIENVKLEEEFNPLILSMGQYEFFMAHGKLGRDAMLLYMHLQYTARRQETNQVWANNIYLQNGIGVGQRKLIQCKTFLHKHSLIEYVQPRDNKTGKMGKTYIKLKYIHKTSTIEKVMNTQESAEKPNEITGSAVTATAAHRSSGSDTQMLKVSNKMLKEKKEGESLGSPPLSQTPKDTFTEAITRIRQAFKQKTGEGIGFKNTTLLRDIQASGYDTPTLLVQVYIYFLNKWHSSLDELIADSGRKHWRIFMKQDGKGSEWLVKYNREVRNIQDEEEPELRQVAVASGDPVEYRPPYIKDCPVCKGEYQGKKCACGFMEPGA